MSSNPSLKEIAMSERTIEIEDPENDKEKMDRLAKEVTEPIASVVRVPQSSQAEKLNSVIQLPSHCQPYDFNELRARPLSTAEVKRIRISIDSQNYKGMYDTIGQCLSVHPKVLTLGDFWYVAAWLRINTYPSIPHRLDWECSKCGSANSKSLDLHGLQSHELSDEYREPAYINVPSGRKVQVRLYRLEDELEVRDFVQEHYKGKSSAATRWMLDIVQTISMEGKSLQDKLDYVNEHLSPDDITYIDHFQSLFTHGLPDEVEVKCTEYREDYEEVCGTVEQIPLRFRLLDLLPSIQHTRHIRDAVVFG